MSGGDVYELLHGVLPRERLLALWDAAKETHRDV